MHPKNTCSVMAVVLILVTVFAGTAMGQCILTNTSFEIGPSGQRVFAGWEQFGAIGSVSETSHGHQAARISGPNSGDWDLSGFWQTHDAVPG